jgi:phage repressor protein C with HTH and peptisase S24 domain
MVNKSFNLVMDIADIRRANLALLIETKTGGNATEFAAMIGRKQSYVSDLGRGEKSFGEKIARAIEIRLELPKLWMDTPHNENLELEEGPLLPAQFRRLPVVGTAQLGPEGYWLETAYPVGRGEGYVEYVSRDEGAYVLRVKGNSMSPTIRSGWLVVIEPNSGYAPGMFVLVCTKDGQCMVKEFLYERDGEIALGSVNDAYARITLTREEIEKIHPVSAIVPPNKMKPW